VTTFYKDFLKSLTSTLTDDDVPPPVSLKSKKSKQAERPKKIIPTLSDVSSSEEDEDEDDEPVTMDNMARRSRKLEAQAAAEAELDLEEAQADAQLAEDEDDDVDMDANEDTNGDMDIEPFHLPTASELEQEKATGGPDIHLVQRRMRECVRVLAKFTRRAEKGR
jgi:ribosomal RNA methyltransferase Nop2